VCFATDSHMWRTKVCIDSHDSTRRRGLCRLVIAIAALRIEQVNEMRLTVLDKHSSFAGDVRRSRVETARM